MADDAVDAAQSRVFHVLEVRKVIGAHKQALSNHTCVRSSLKAMQQSVHEAEVRLNAAPTAIDPDDQLSRRTCIPDDDPRVEAIVSMMEQEGSGKALAALRNLTAERYWETRWQREWETKYHDPLVGIKRQEQEYIALGALDAGMHRRRARRVRAALKDRESKPEFDPAKRARERAQDFVLQRRRGPADTGCPGGRPRTAFGSTNKPVAATTHRNVDKTRTARAPPEAVAAAPGPETGQGGQGGRDRQGGHEENGAPDEEMNRRGDGKNAATSPARAEAATVANRPRSRCHTADPRGTSGAGRERKRPPRSTFATCPRFADGPGWDENFTGRALARLAKLDPPLFDYTEGALDSIARCDNDEC